MPTKIEWTDETWNPVTGCTKVSPGCAHCYAERMAKRLAGRYGYPANDPFRVTIHDHRIVAPLDWRKPRRVFVCSMGDLFHPDIEVLDEFLVRDVFEVMALCRHHTFQVLTKRPEVAEAMLTDEFAESVYWAADAMAEDCQYRYGEITMAWPLPNVWVGVTAENQEAADERIPILLRIPAAIRFVSLEPLLGPIDLSRYLTDQCGYYCDPPDEADHYMDGHYDHRWETLDWVIVGGESGPGARPMNPAWVRSVRDQCIDAGVPFFFKSWGKSKPVHQWQSNGIRLLDGREWNQLPPLAINS